MTRIRYCGTKSPFLSSGTSSIFEHKHPTASGGDEKVQFISQMGQDAWIVEEVFEKKKCGFFLDLAAFDGVTIKADISSAESTIGRAVLKMQS